ncbi:MAG: TOBE domain-containing protein [Desulfurivibrionaceae bacterium]
MALSKREINYRDHATGPDPSTGARCHGRIISTPDGSRCLATDQLQRLEQSFRAWAESAVRADVRLSRRRILLIFLLIRYTGAKLNEVLALDPFADADPNRQTVFFGRAGSGKEGAAREVTIPESLCHEIQAALSDPGFRNSPRKLFDIDSAFVRRKFYERAQACGFDKRLGGPEMIRRARAVELMRGNLPLPAVQMLLGHSTPNLTSAYISFSKEEIRELTRFFMERESSRKTSARNAFFGKIVKIRQGEIQSRVELATVGGHSIITLITNDSLHSLGLKEGRLATAEVKAPWVILQKGGREPACSAENRCKGFIARKVMGAINTEYVVSLADGTELCSITGTAGHHAPDFAEGDKVWALFNCFSVVLHVA